MAAAANEGDNVTGARRWESKRRTSPRLPAPTIYTDAAGHTGYRGRRQALYINHRGYCPNLQRIPESGMMLEVDTLICRHAMPAAPGPTRECGIRLYVLGQMKRWCPEESKVVEVLVAVEVTRDELLHVRTLSVPDALEYLETGF
jgi:hypothetical protein